MRYWQNRRTHRSAGGVATSSMACGVSSLGDWRSSQIRGARACGNEQDSRQSTVGSRQSQSPVTVFSPSRQSESAVRVASRVASRESPVGSRQSESPAERLRASVGVASRRAEPVAGAGWCRRQSMAASQRQPTVRISPRWSDPRSIKVGVSPSQSARASSPAPRPRPSIVCGDCRVCAESACWLRLTTPTDDSD